MCRAPFGFRLRWISAVCGSTRTFRWWPRCRTVASSRRATARICRPTGSRTTPASSTSWPLLARRISAKRYSSRPLLALFLLEYRFAAGVGPEVGEQLRDSVAVDEQRCDVPAASDLLDATVGNRGAGAAGFVGTPTHRVVAHGHHQRWNGDA